METSYSLRIGAVGGQWLCSWWVHWAAHFGRGLSVEECVIAGVGERSGRRLAGNPWSPTCFKLLLAVARGGRGMVGWRWWGQRRVEAHQRLQVSEHALDSWCTVDPAATRLAQSHDRTLISEALFGKELVRVLKQSMFAVRIRLYAPQIRIG